MAIQLLSTKGARFQNVKALVYGQSGVGKTTLIRTLPNPVILSAEAGLLSLSGEDLPFIEVKSLADLREAREYVTASDYESIALDSISEIAEICLSEEKKKTKDGRAAYGALNEIISDEIRKFRDIPGKNVFFIAKADKETDQDGKILYGPSMPGKTLSNGLAYHFDLVLALRAEKNAEGVTVRALMTETDGLWQAKARGFKLSPWEPADLGEVIKKVRGA